MKNKVKKRTNGHYIQIEMEQLKSKIPLVVEMEDLLLQLEANSISDFETKINALTKFTNPMASANAYLKATEYVRLLELETLIDGKLSSGDLTKTKDLKNSIITEVIEKNTEYYTPSELSVKKVLEGVMQTFNSLNLEERRQVAFSHLNEIKYTPFSELRF